MILNSYINVRQPQVHQSLPINDWLSQIKNSTYSDTITQARKGLLDYNDTKLSLPCVTYNFTYNNYKKDSNIISSTGLLYIDIDNPMFNIESLDTNKVYSYYNSFGGHGYSLLIKIDGLTKNNFSYNYRHISEQLGISDYIDTNAAKASQYNILSYDENIFINEDCYVFTAINDAPPTTVIKERKKNKYTSEGGKLRFNNLDEIDLEGNDYIVDWEGIEYINCFIPMKKREAGQRNSFLLSYCNNLVCLNPHLSKEAIGTIMCHVNEKACFPCVTQNKVFTVVNSIFKYKEDGTLQPIAFKKLRKFVFDKTLKLSKNEKFAIMNTEISKKRMNDSQNKISDILYDWDFEKHGKITQRAVYKNHPISKKTVEKYWEDYKDTISDLNHQNSENKAQAIDEAKVPIMQDNEVKKDEVNFLLNEIKEINVDSQLYLSQRSLILYVTEKGLSLGEDGIKHFHNELFKHNKILTLEITQNK